jgi:hypothetical protein
LAFCGFSEEWLQQQLLSRRIPIDEVLFMSADENGVVNVIKKEPPK